MSHFIPSPMGALVLGIIAFPLYIAWYLLFRNALSPLRVLPTMPKKSYLHGNFSEIMQAEPGREHLRMQKETGSSTFRYFALFGEERVLTTDQAALNHILVTHSYDYPKPNEVRANVSRILGRGILFAEGDDHRRQKRIMQPAFSPSHIKAVTPTFFEQAYILRDKWSELVSTSAVEQTAFKDESAATAYKQSRAEKNDEEAIIDAIPWLSRVTLDIIGITGFGYAFNSLTTETKSPLATAFATMLAPSSKKPSPSTMLIFGLLNRLIPKLPFLEYIPHKRIQGIRRGFATIDEECSKIVASKKEQVLRGELDTVGGGKDLITLLLRANLAETNPNLKMTDTELQGQVTTFMLAGHETTATALTWTLWLLSSRQAVQDRLRSEIEAARRKAAADGRDEMSYEELNALPYMDAVVREVLRVEPPVAGTVRSSSKDDHVPLSKPIKLNSGQEVSSFFMPKDTTIFLSVVACNFSEEIFGEKPEEFRPERWLDGKVGEKVSGTGVFSHLLTFLAGPRACIGYRFSLCELKAILAVLIGDFVFLPRDGDEATEIERRSALVSRPLVVGEEALGYRMPLRVRTARKEDL